MINVYNFTGQDEEKCRMEAYEQLDVYENEIITKVYQEEDSYKKFIH